MFDIGFWEMLLIAVLTMIIVGPERLPGAARTAGRWVGKARRFIEGVKSDVEQEFDVTEFKRLLHNQEVKINELSEKLSSTNILDEQIESLTSSVYDISDEASNGENKADAKKVQRKAVDDEPPQDKSNQKKSNKNETDSKTIKHDD